MNANTGVRPALSGCGIVRCSCGSFHHSPEETVRGAMLTVKPPSCAISAESGRVVQHVGARPWPLGFSDCRAPCLPLDFHVTFDEACGSFFVLQMIPHAPSNARRAVSLILQKGYW